MNSLIFTTVWEFGLALGRTTPEAVNGTPMTGAAESFGLLAVWPAVARAVAGRPPMTAARTSAARTS